MKRGATEMPAAAEPQEAQFGLSIAIRTPPGRTLNLANLVKPVFDGAIAAFHAHTGAGNPAS